MKTKYTLVAITVVCATLFSNNLIAAPGDAAESRKLKRALTIGTNASSVFTVDDIMETVSNNDKKSYLTRIRKDEDETLSFGFSTVNDLNTNSDEFFNSRDWKLERIEVPLENDPDKTEPRLVLTGSKDDKYEGEKNLRIEFFVGELSEDAVPRDPETNSSLYMIVKSSNLGVVNENTGRVAPFIGDQVILVRSSFQLGSLYVNNGVLFQKQGALQNVSLSVAEARNAFRRVLANPRRVKLN